MNEYIDDTYRHVSVLRTLSLNRLDITSFMAAGGSELVTVVRWASTPFEVVTRVVVTLPRGACQTVVVVVARTPSGACTQRDQGARPRIFPTLARARTLGACTYEIKTLENIKLCREVNELQLKLEDDEVVN